MVKTHHHNENREIFYHAENKIFLPSNSQRILDTNLENLYIHFMDGTHSSCLLF